MELVLMIKREGIDKQWQIAPYQVHDHKHAERLVKFITPTVPVPFEWKVIEIR